MTALTAGWLAGAGAGAGARHLLVEARLCSLLKHGLGCQQRAAHA